MTPAEVLAYRRRLDLSQRDLGEALGLQDAARTVRAWEEGVRNGKPCTPAGTALAAMRYLEAILGTLDANLPPTAVVARLRASLPEELRNRT